MIHRLVIVLPCALLLAAQPSPDLDAKIAAALKDTGAPSVSVAVIRNAELVYAKAFGSANVAAGRNADVNTRYAVGSIGKQFTAAALLLLQEQGKLSLDDKGLEVLP